MPVGILDQVSFGQESAVGSAVTPNVSVAVLPSDGIKMEQEPVGVEAINTQPGKNKDFVAGLREYNGSFALNAYPQALGYFLKSALGAVNSAAASGETVVYDHTFTESAVKPSLTVEQKTGDITNRFTGFIVSSLEFAFQAGEALKVTVTGKAMNHASATAITASYETTKVFDWTDIQSITLGGVDIKAAVETLSLTYTNNLESFHGVSSQVPTQLYPQNSEVTGSIEAYLDSNLISQEAVFAAGTEQSLVITLTGDETIGDASHNGMVITLPKVVLASYTVPLDTSYVKVSADLTAGVSSASGMISVVLTNAVASY